MGKNKFYKTTLFILFLIALNIKAADYNETLKLYKQIMAGQIKLDDLSPTQQRDVLAIFQELKREECENCTDECIQNRKDANNLRGELAEYIKKLYNCIQENDLSNDCYSEFRRVKSLYSDFESSISNVSNSCH